MLDKIHFLKQQVRNKSIINLIELAKKDLWKEVSNTARFLAQITDEILELEKQMYDEE